MSNEISQFEARAYKRLYEMYKSTLVTIIHVAKNTSESNPFNPARCEEILTAIGDEKCWDKYGFESKGDSKIVDELEKCLGV
jgi:hypothetical protein